MHRIPFIAALLVGICLSSTIEAHYLWVKISKSDSPKSQGVANFYFEHAASPGDGHYIDPYLKTKSTWIRTVEKIEPRLLPLVEKKVGDDKRWAVANLPDGSPRSIDSYWKFGTYRYGKKDVLLHYYARYLDVDSHEDLHELSRARKMNLDIIPHDVLDQMELVVIWKGLPVKDQMVFIHGPKGFRVNLKTDKRGKVVFKMKNDGEYYFRTSFEEEKAGKDNGKPYSSIRHHATLIMPLPLKE